MTEEKKINQDLDFGDIDNFEENNEEKEKINKWATQRLREKKFIKISNYLFSFAVVLLVIFFVVYGSVLFLNTKIDPSFQIEEGSVKSYAKNLWKFFLKKVWYIKESINGEGVCSRIESMIGRRSLDEVNEKIQDCIDSKQVNIIVKKNVLNGIVDKLFSEYERDKKAIEKIKENIAKYAFLPKQIDELIYWWDISDLLITVEGIKLSAFLRLYIYIDSLKDRLISSIWGVLNSEIIDDILKNNVFSRWDIIIKNFLINCYFNPYVISTDTSKCVSMVGTDDFAEFLVKEYKFSKSKTKMIELILWHTIDDIINSTEGANLNIVFNSLDPKNKTISFKAEIISYKEDKKDIKVPNDKSKLLVFWDQIDPHVFLATTFINFLRESHFILGDNIHINSLKVTQRKLKNLGNKIVNVSSFNFKVKLQPSVVREIYDFIYGK